jgi:hypothetical protein
VTRDLGQIDEIRPNLTKIEKADSKYDKLLDGQN